MTRAGLGGTRAALRFVVLGIAIAAFAQDVRGQVAGWRVVGQIGGATQAIATQGGYAYAGTGLRLAVLDISNPSDLREVGVTEPFASAVEDVAVSGTIAYVAAGGSGLRVVDVSRPSSPTEIGAWDSRGYAQAVAVAGTTAYLADGPYGLRVVDVSQPSAPKEIGFAYPMNYAFDVAVQGRYAYIAAAGSGLLVADVSDPRHPVEAGSLLTSGYAYGVAVSGSVVLVADGWEGVKVVDIADPAHPYQIGSYKTPGWAFDVAVFGSTGYVAAALGGMQILDVSAPSRLSALGAFLPEGRIDAKKVAISGDIVYLAELSKGVRAVRVSDPHNPVQLGVYGPVPYARDVAAFGNFALIAAAWGGARVVNLSDPKRPTEVATYETRAEADRVAVTGSTACVRMGTDVGETDDARLVVLDVREPTKPATLGTFAYRQPVIQGLAIADGFLYATDEFGLAVISIRDPRTPLQVGYTSVNGAWGLAVTGHRAYVASTHRGLNILDAPEQGDPTLLGSLQFTTGQIRDVAPVGSLAYVAAHGYGLHIVNIADPSNPRIVGSAGLEPSAALAVAVIGNTAFVATDEGGVRVFDVTRAEAPVLVGTILTAGCAFDVAAQGDRLLIADGPGGLLVLERTAASAAETTNLDGSWPMSGAWSVSAIDAASASHAPGDVSPRPPRARGRDPEIEALGAPPGARVARRDASPVVSALATECLVTTTADGGPGSLSWCIGNAAAGAVIRFDAAVFPPSNPATIAVNAGLPSVWQGMVTIDGSDVGVIVDGANAPPSTSGFNISSSGNVIRGLQIVNFKNAGISLSNTARDNTIGGSRLIGAGPTGQGCVISGNGVGINFAGAGVSDTVIEGNLIGTDATGMRAFPNRDFGLFIMDSSRNRVGSTAAGRSNVISGSSTAVDIQRFHATGNRITGNLIGLALDGSTPIGNQWGVTVQLGASANRIEKNVISANALEAILVVDERSSYNVIAGNLVGTDARGREARGNLGGVAIHQNVIQGWNLIGGKTAEGRNVIAGNAGGVVVSGSENFVIGNFFGTNVDGTGAIGGARDGVNVGGVHNFVGGFSPAERNVISGTRFGLSIGGYGTRSTFVMGNRVGTDVSGTSALPNQADGVVVEWDAEATFIQSNVVSGNTWSGVRIRSGAGNRLRGNLIGTAADGRAPLGNAFDGVRVEGASNAVGGALPGDGNVVAHNAGRGVAIIAQPANVIGSNSIFDNRTGIELAAGGNNGLPAPVVSSVTEVAASGSACPGCRVEIFSDAEDEGRIFEGSTVADGAGGFTFTRASGYLTGPNVTATATDGAGNTSRFSAPKPVPGRAVRRQLRGR